MRYISLFSGIGGLDLGFDWAGWECVAQVEINDHCREVLARHWPKVPKFKDVREYHPDRKVPAVIGGFPCQDLSLAGKRAGLAGERSGLFYEFVRIASEAEADWLIFENVRGLLSSDGGRDFGRVLEELAARRFDVEWELLPASAFGAAHERARLFVVAHRNGTHGQIGDLLGQSRERVAALQSGRLSRMAACEAARQRPGARLPGEPRLGRLVHGASAGVDIKDRLTALGNAVYPTVPWFIAEKINEAIRPR